MNSDKEIFEMLSDDLFYKLQNEKIDGIMRYKPFDDSYWVAHPRILICNLENYGYDKDDTVLFDRILFRKWLNSDIKTIKNSSLFVYGLKQKLSGKNLTVAQLVESYKNNNLLEDAMIDSAYMNLRPTSGKQTKQDSKNITILVNKYAKELQEFIKSLNPDIIIVSSSAATELLNSILNLVGKQKILFRRPDRNWTKYNNSYIFSIHHFSRVDYGEFIKKFEKIYSILNKKVDVKLLSDYGLNIGDEIIFKQTGEKYRITASRGNMVRNKMEDGSISLSLLTKRLVNSDIIGEIFDYWDLGKNI